MTLESEDGDTVVVEQDANGRVKCEPHKSGKPERAANSAPKPPPKAEGHAAKQDKAKPDRKPPKASGSEASPKAEDAPKAKASAAPVPARAPRGSRAEALRCAGRPSRITATRASPRRPAAASSRS
ncbi:hypothetical protein [Nannocystis pusilla]|uniref:hypothetical protein n=1 Tax=Nannocystis pusilla TaxID=889268 RepID=UPI003B7A0EA8